MIDKNKDVIFELNGQHFIWNNIKAENNITKHRVDFQEAATVFMNFSTEYYDDEEHADKEQRFIALGMSKQHNLLMVCHCIRENETMIRIISARKAAKHEQKRRRREI